MEKICRNCKHWNDDTQTMSDCDNLGYCENDIVNNTDIGRLVMEGNCSCKHFSMIVKQRVVCAAIKNTDGDIICGPRHFDIIMRLQIMNSKKDWIIPEQGFVDQFGKFLNRKEAYIVAKSAEQIIRPTGGDEGKLFSENIY